MCVCYLLHAWTLHVEGNIYWQYNFHPCSLKKDRSFISRIIYFIIDLCFLHCLYFLFNSADNMNWACRGQSLLTLAFICGLDFMEILIASASASTSGTIETSCGVEVATRLCPRTSNSSMPCCYELVGKKIKKFTTKNSEEGTVEIYVFICVE